jgi:hypothetical protein
MKGPIANLDFVHATTKWDDDSKPINHYAYTIREAETQAIDAFCAINDWKLTDACRGFAVAETPEQADIYPHGTATIYDFCGFMDHRKHFKRHGRPVAIMSSPYDTEPDDLPALYGKLGGYNKVALKWSVPPARFASLYYPRWTSCYILTRPETEVRWLPEQMKPNAFSKRRYK